MQKDGVMQLQSAERRCESTSPFWRGRENAAIGMASDLVIEVKTCWTFFI